MPEFEREIKIKQPLENKEVMGNGCYFSYIGCKEYEANH